MIILMNQSAGNSKINQAVKNPPPLCQSIILLIIFTFGAVTLFGAIVYLFISGAERLGLPLAVHIAIFVIISGIFAWLVKRITDMVSGMSQHWFPEDDDDDNRT
jgi:membrane protein implicated in regulation of membrane protease activity